MTNINRSLSFQKFWKYSIILIFIETYLLWNNVFTGTEDPEFYSSSGEKGFYVSGLIVLTEHLLFFSLLYGFLRVFGHGSFRSVRLLWKAMTLSNFSKLLFIPVMIWRMSSKWELGINYVLIIGYSILSLVCSLSGESLQFRCLFLFAISLCFTIPLPFQWSPK